MAASVFSSLSKDVQDRYIALAFSGDKEDLKELIANNSDIPQNERINVYADAQVKAQEKAQATQGGQSNGVIRLNSGVNGGQAGQGDSIDVAAVCKIVKQEMIEKKTYKYFKNCVSEMDTAGMEFYLKDLTPFKRNPQLLTTEMINSLLPLFYTAETRKRLDGKIDDVKLDQARNYATTNEKIKKTAKSVEVQGEWNSQQHSQTRSTQENMQQELESQKQENSMNRFYVEFGFGLLTVGAILGYCYGSGVGIYERPYDAVVIIEFAIICVLAVGFGMGEIKCCRNIAYWITQQIINTVLFVTLGVIAGTQSYGGMDPVIATILYFLCYVLSFIMICYIFYDTACWKHCCQSRSCCELCNALLVLVKLRESEKKSISGGTETGSNYAPVNVVVDGNNKGTSHEENKKKETNSQENTPPPVCKDSGLDIVRGATSQENIGMSTENVGKSDENVGKNQESEH